MHLRNFILLILFEKESISKLQNQWTDLYVNLEMLQAKTGKESEHEAGTPVISFWEVAQLECRGSKISNGKQRGQRGSKAAGWVV